MGVAMAFYRRVGAMHELRLTGGRRSGGPAGAKQAERAHATTAAVRLVQLIELDPNDCRD